jgi:hypothetical protein
MRNTAIVLLGTALAMGTSVAAAHHSFAMYNQSQTYVMTGIVTRVDPNPNHLQMFVAPLNEARDQVLKDANGETIVWAIEMDGAAREALDGITVNGFPRGTIVSVGLHPLRNGFPGGGRGESGLYRCPADTPPAAGMHCDSVEGSTPHGKGVLPEPSGVLPMPARD